MLKYDSSLDFSVTTSLTLIAKRINPGSRILEFGPATGYMTKYFKEALGCSIVAIELDPESAKISSEFCEKMIIGNIDSYPWLEELSNDSFDHIIFSDVLEHLYDPWEALKKSSKLLKTNGTMLTSIPNIAHSAIIMNLMSGQFDYQNIGLLDQTHIRFFTNKSIRELLDQANLEPVEWLYTQCSAPQTEFKKYYQNFSEPIQEYLKNRPDAEVYQYVSVSKRKEDVTPEQKIRNDVNTSLLGFDIPICTAWLINSSNTLCHSPLQVRLNGENQWTTYKLEINIPFDIKTLGLNPSNQPSICEIRDVKLKLSDGTFYDIQLEKTKNEKCINLNTLDNTSINFITFTKGELHFQIEPNNNLMITAILFQMKVDRNIDHVIDNVNNKLQKSDHFEFQSFNQLKDSYVDNLKTYKSILEAQQKEIIALKKDVFIFKQQLNKSFFQILMNFIKK